MPIMKSRRLFYIDRVTKLLLETGNPRMKVDEIASKLGITKKTIYNYFDSKQQMFECVLDTFLKQRLELIKKKLLYKTNPIESLINIGHNIGSVFQDCSMFIENSNGFDKENTMFPIFMARRKELIELLDYLFGKGIREGLIESDVDTKLASQVYLSGIETLFKNNGLLNTNLISRHQVSQVLFYMVKGNCTTAGLSYLREKVDIKVMVC